MSRAEARNDGSKVGAARTPPALNPEQMALTQPWKDYVSRGLITINAVFAPTGTSIKISVISDAVKLPDGVSRTEAPPGIVRQALIDAGFSKKKKDDGKKSSPLPKRSLCARDLEVDGDLIGRIRSVADAIGATAAAGRIGSMQLYIDGCETFDDWWSKAKPGDKARLLMDEKNANALTSEQRSLIASKLGGQCPFRGPVPTPKEEEKVQPKEKAQSSSQKTGGESSKGSGKKRSS